MNEGDLLDRYHELRGALVRIKEKAYGYYNEEDAHMHMLYIKEILEEVDI